MATKSTKMTAYRRVYSIIKLANVKNNVIFNVFINKCDNWNINEINSIYKREIAFDGLI